MPKLFSCCFIYHVCIENPTKIYIRVIVCLFGFDRQFVDNTEVDPDACSFCLSSSREHTQSTLYVVRQSVMEKKSDMDSRDLRTSKEGNPNIKGRPIIGSSALGITRFTDYKVLIILKC